MGNLPLMGGIGIGVAVMALVGPKRVAAKLRRRKSGGRRFLLSLFTGSISGAVSGAVIHFALAYLHRLP